MNSKTSVLAMLLALSACFGQEAPPKHELAFALGGFPSIARNPVELGPGIALEVNYARRVFSSRKAALYGEVQFLASPLREVTSANASATRDVASLYVTPGIRVKFFPTSAVSPYLAAGGGVAWYEQSRNQLNGQPNAAPRERSTGAFDFGGGADVRVWRFLALRGEARDFFTGSPAYNVDALRGGQHNVVISAAFVIRWH